MKTKFIELYSKLFDKIDVEFPIAEIKLLSSKHNIDIVHFCVKMGKVSIIDPKPNVEKRHVVREMLLLLELVSNKYPNLNVEFLHIDDDFPCEVLYNLPVFGMAYNPSKGVYNPVTFYEQATGIKSFEERHVNQLSFEKKQTKVFGRYGISGLHGTNKYNWIHNYKIQFVLASLMCPNLIDIKFLFVPHDLKLLENYINDILPIEIRDTILSLPIYDTSVTNLWIQTLNHAFESKICIFNEGNSIASPGRILTCLYNDGVMIKIGRNEFKSFLDILIESIDETLVYSNHERPDNTFYTSIENSLCDETYRINKNKLVKEYFNQNVIIDLTYETLNLYRILSGQ